MCAGCDWPGCGGACGTNDWDLETYWSGEVTCSKCGEVQDVEEEVEVRGRGNSGGFLLKWICETCGEPNEYEGEYEKEDDREPPEPDDPSDYYW